MSLVEHENARLRNKCLYKQQYEILKQTYFIFKAKLETEE